MTSNLKIDNEVLPDNLKCEKCKLVLRDTYPVPCKCRFDRTCVNNLESGCETAGDYTESHLPTISTVNKSVDQLANVENHLGVYPRKSVECPIHRLGCKQNKLVVEEKSGHIRQKNRFSSEILIKMIDNVNKEMATYKGEIESNRREIYMLRSELLLRDEQISTIIDQIGHVINENKSIREEKEDIALQLTILSEKMKTEIDEQDKTVVTPVIGPNNYELETEIKSIKNDILSINQCMKSMKEDIYSIKSEMKTVQPVAEPGQNDANCEWTINEDVENTTWGWGHRASEFFTGVMHPYRYQISSWNDGTPPGSLRIYLRIYRGPSDARLAWPFTGTVSVTVAAKFRRELCRSATLQIVIDRPAEDRHGCSEHFIFPHCSLTEAGLDLKSGVLVSCAIVPDAGQ